MRYLLGPEKPAGKSQDDIMTAWRGFFNEQYAKVLEAATFEDIRQTTCFLSQEKCSPPKAAKRIRGRNSSQRQLSIW